MKDRLIELLDGFVLECVNNCPKIIEGTRECHKCAYGKIADYLLANGVNVPPVKIGQELWEIHYNRPRKWEVVYLGYNGKEWFINVHWWKDKHNFATRQISYPFLGKMWYFSKEEAERALQGKDEGK